MSEFVEVKLTGDMELDLSRFEQKVKDLVLFSGVAAMAKVIYDEAHARVPVSTEGHWFYGTSFKAQTGRKFRDGTARSDWAGGTKYWFEPGTLKSSIYRVYSPEKSNEERKTYRISWNKKEAPYGSMVEFGTSRAPAHPFMRPAFGHINAAIAAGQNRMRQRLADGVVEVAP